LRREIGSWKENKWNPNERRTKKQKMEMNILYWVILAVGIIMLGMVQQKVFKKNGTAKKVALIGGIVLVAYGLIGGLASVDVISNLGFAEGIFFTATAPIVNGGTSVPITVDEGASSRVIDTLKIVEAKEKFSNAYDQVAGTLNFYDAGTDPSSPTASAIDTITVSAGAGSTTNAKLRTNTAYRVTFDGDGSYYDVDYGVITISESDYNPSTGTASISMGEVMKVSTIDDMMNESAVDGVVNGQTVATPGTAELGSNATDILWYDESVGDGQFYIEPTLSFSGANTGIKNAVLAFEWDTSNPPEGNEISALTYQLTSGTDLGIPSDLLNYWSTEEAIALGTSINGGTSSKIKLTITYDETNLDTTDVWYLAVDDLGELRGKDINLDTGATLDRITFNAQA